MRWVFQLKLQAVQQLKNRWFSGDFNKFRAWDILFIDEIHRLPRIVEEVLYAAMKTMLLILLLVKTRSHVQSDLIFRLYFDWRTTRFGDLSGPWEIDLGLFRLGYYNLEDLERLLEEQQSFETKIDKEAVIEIAKRSRGTPRIANRLLRRTRDFAEVIDNGNISKKVSYYALDKLGISPEGLDETDKEYLKTIIEKFNGGPVGLDAISAAIGEEPTTVEDVYEPYLLQEGFIKRTSRGRVALEKSYDFLGIKYYKEGLFNEWN